MSGHVKVSGAFKTLVSGTAVKVGGAWKDVETGYVKVSGAWKEFFQNTVNFIVTVATNVGTSGYVDGGFGSISPDPASVEGANIEGVHSDTDAYDFRVDLAGSLASNFFTQVDVEDGDGVNQSFTTDTALHEDLTSHTTWTWVSAPGGQVWDIFDDTETHHVKFLI